MTYGWRNLEKTKYVHQIFSVILVYVFRIKACHQKRILWDYWSSVWSSLWKSSLLIETVFCYAKVCKKFPSYRNQPTDSRNKSFSWLLCSGKIDHCFHVLSTSPHASFQDIFSIIGWFKTYFLYVWTALISHRKYWCLFKNFVSFQKWYFEFW